MDKQQGKSSAPRAVAVTTDLIFASKIRGTGAAMGIETISVGTPQGLVESLDAGHVRLVMVDMSLPADVACQALRAASTHACKPANIAFYSHVRTDLADAARQAGATEVMARSQFAAQLPQILGKTVAASD